MALLVDFLFLPPLLILLDKHKSTMKNQQSKMSPQTSKLSDSVMKGK
jgi:hypothetical protein